jgi:hypothetical protein
MNPTEIDLDRLPYEIGRALWANNFATELLDPGLALTEPREDGTVGVVDRYGTELAAVAVYRLRRPDADRLAERIRDVADSAGLSADELAAATVVAPPGEEWVTMRLGARRWRWHRCVLVEGWPDDA